MAYIGQGIKQGTFKVLDTSGNTYNGSNTTFSLGTQVGSAAQLLVSHDGVIQKAGTDYTLATGGTQITFSTAPASGASIFIVEISGAVGGTVTPSDASVTTDKLGADAVTEAKIADDAVESEHLNNNIISGQTALGATPADTDEFLVSDAGTIKRVDYSYIKGSSTIGGLTDVNMDGTNFTDSILIQTNTDGSAPTTGTLSDAIGNVGIGKDVFKALTSADYAVGIGYEALDVHLSGSYPIAIGAFALSSSTTSDSIAIGGSALNACDTEQDNLAIGFQAMKLANSGAEDNTVVGNFAGDAITSADGNVLIGHHAGGAITTGNQNIIIGVSAAPTLTTGGTNFIIGSNCDVSADNADQQIVIGYNQTAVGNNHFSFGSENTNRVYNEFTSNASWTRSSDERLKKDINTNEDCGLDFINDLRTVTFKWKAPSEQPEEFTSHDPEKTEPKYKDKLYGFIAQEVKTALDKHNITNFNGWNSAPDGDNNDIQGISYEMFVVPLVKSIQELSKKVEDLEKKLEDK
jgi:hypothetical protein